MNLLQIVVALLTLIAVQLAHSGETPIEKSIESASVLSASKFLYKIVSLEDWEASLGQEEIRLSPFDSDFIHLATKEQIAHVAGKFFKGKEHVILTIETKDLIGRLIYEANPGGSTKYYHLYEGSVPLEAVIACKKG